MKDAILVLNAGSSSLKFALYRVDVSDEPSPVCRGSIEEIGRHASLRILLNANAEAPPPRSLSARDHAQAMDAVLAWLEPRLAGYRLLAAGHRVVHGGPRHARPVRVDDEVLAHLDTLVPIDPLHQPHNLNGIRALLRARPGLTQVACFDTAFHRTMPEVAQRLALPRELHEAGVQRYGFHGLSYEYIAGVLPEHLGEAAEGRVIVAHLGNGASLCALHRRRSVDTTMSFTPLDGLPMGTRCGALDPAVPLYLMRERGMSEREVCELLHRRSGLLGLSGISSDMRELLASPDPRAAAAVEHYTHKVAQAIGALAMSLGGLDSLVFTAGIGEHATPVRAAISRRCAWLGLELDEAANAIHACRITTADSKVSAWVIPTDEERIIARHSLALAAP